MSPTCPSKTLDWSILILETAMVVALGNASDVGNLGGALLMQDMQMNLRKTGFRPSSILRLDCVAGARPHTRVHPLLVCTEYHCGYFGPSPRPNTTRLIPLLYRMYVPLNVTP